MFDRRTRMVDTDKPATKWVLAGVSRSDMIDRTRAALAANTYVLPEPGAMGFMLSTVQPGGIESAYRPPLSAQQIATRRAHALMDTRIGHLLDFITSP